MASLIQIPDDAPFTPEQRAWLGDFLAKLLHEGSATPPTAAPVPVTVLYGSQTGNAEGLAKIFVKQLKKGGFDPEIQDMGAYDRARLPQEKHLLVITSTYGDGEPPDNAADFYGWLLADGVPRLEGVKFSVLALGDTSYPDFCKCGIDIDARLEGLGATRLFKRVDSDVDYDPPFAEWAAGVMAALAPSRAVVLSNGAAVVDAVSEGFSKKNPFPAPVLRNFNLNGPGAKETHHVELSLDGSGLEYEVGDALGVVPANAPEVVDELISFLPFRPSVVPLPGGGEAPLREALIHHYDIGTLNKSVIQKWQQRSGSPFLRSLVEGDDKQAWEAFSLGRDLIDLVIDHPADFSDAEEFVSVLKKLQPRLYSIASSPRAHPGEVHLCIGIVRYHTYGRQRGGICSTYFADRLASSPRPRSFVHVNKAFRLPESGETPLIMVGPGTGIAPFRAFLEDRKASGASGRNWLFFGNPHEATDYLYREEIEAFHRDGLLNRLDLAWSRDQKEKRYVQHLMLRQGAELWSWLQAGAAFYVCGDASRMAKDVDAALHQIAMEHGSLDDEGAKAYLSQLKKDKRYQRDVY